MNHSNKINKKYFLDLAKLIKYQMEKLLCEKVKDDYIYSHLLKLIKEVEDDQYPKKPRKTDIGIATVKTLNIKSTLTKNICELSELYRKLPDKKE